MTPAQRRQRNEYMRNYMRARYRKLKLEAGRRRFWSPEAVEWLCQAYPNQLTSKLALAMGRDAQAVYAKAAALGLRKTKAFFDLDVATRIKRGLAPGAVRHQFPKGHVPANKGLRRPGWAPGRMAQTQFKKGQIPHNGRFPLQSERVNTDGYRDRKVSMTCKGSTAWMPVHRLVWMQAHGDIPSGHVVVFRDGNKLNCELANLQLITLRENMRRNSVHNLPKPLAEIVQLRGALVRQINRKGKQHEQQRRAAEGQQDRGPARDPVRHVARSPRQGKAHGHRARKSRGRGRARDRVVGKGRG